MKFEWDEEKSELNHKKHSIRFEEAQTVFADPDAIEFFDEDRSNEEDSIYSSWAITKDESLTCCFL